MRLSPLLRTPCVLALALFAAACDGGGTDAPVVDTVIIEADDSEVAVGATLQLQATAYDDDGDVITGQRVQWSSSDTDVATVSSTGVLTGVSGGTVDITAQIGGERDVQTFEVVDDDCPSVAYTIGTTVTGTLAAGDCEFGDGTRADLYRVVLTSARPVQITLRSTAFNAYLVLYDADGRTIEENDNGAGGSDARITRTLSAGTYFIAANSFDISSGSYTLSSQ